MTGGCWKTRIGCKEGERREWERQRGKRQLPSSADTDPAARMGTRVQNRPKKQRGRLIPYPSPPSPSCRPRATGGSGLSRPLGPGRRNFPAGGRRSAGAASTERGGSVASSTAEPHAPVVQQELCSRQRGGPAGYDGGAERGEKWDTPGDKFAKSVVWDARGSCGRRPRSGVRRFPFPPCPSAPSLPQALLAVK